MTQGDEVPDLERVKAAIRAAQQAEQELLKLDANAVRHDEGHPILAPNDEDRAAHDYAKHHGRRGTH